jgi:hypothetical protein
MEARMPETAPLGEVELTVTYQERASEPYKLTLVGANGGFYTPSNAPDALPEAKHGVDAVCGGIVTLWGLRSATYPRPSTRKAWR